MTPHHLLQGGAEMQPLVFFPKGLGIAHRAVGIKILAIQIVLVTSSQELPYPVGEPSDT